MNKLFVFLAMMILLSGLVITFYQLETSPGNTSAEHKETLFSLYQRNCSSCHGNSGEGFQSYPALHDNRLNIAQIKELIKSGSGEMPAFPNLTEDELSKLAQYISNM